VTCSLPARVARGPQRNRVFVVAALNRASSISPDLNVPVRKPEEYREEIRDICSAEEILGIYSDLTGFIPAGTRMIRWRTLIAVRSL
jgi:hypothetical protein